VPVKVQVFVNGHWKTFDLVTTKGTGAYSTPVGDASGKFRALAKRVTVGGGDKCMKDVSPAVKA
jgi:hypothetical protein